MTYFSESDIKQIESYGLTLSAIEQQLADFKSGFPPADIVSAATINDGILAMLDRTYVEYYELNKDKYNIPVEYSNQSP